MVGVLAVSELQSAGSPSGTRLVLASRSPRRRELLRAAGLDFTIHVSDIDEDLHWQKDPAGQACATARAKALEVAEREPRDAVVIGADTIVVLNGEVFTKPEDRDHARQMLRRLSGRAHTVITGLCLARSGGPYFEEAVHARVIFNTIGDELLEQYIASGEPEDKAGAYGIQGLGARLVAAVEGDLTCVIGLPMRRLNMLHTRLTGRPLWNGRPLREIALGAFPDLAALPEACLRGMDPPDADR